MAAIDTQVGTGLPGLDLVFKGLMPGDNIVWQVESVDDYLPLVKPYCEYARSKGRRLIYFRFARHEPLVPDSAGAEVHTLNPEAGFETFLTDIHNTIEAAGRGAYYVFDCLSDLAADWYSDQMLGNFFMLTCPYLYDLETIAYFALLRRHHSAHATGPIMETTQIFSDIYRHRGEPYVHPLKVQQRYSPTMHMLHVWRGDDFIPVTDSATISEIMASVPWSGLEAMDSRLNIWDRLFQEAEEVMETEQESGRCSLDDKETFCRALKMVVSRDERVVRLAEKHLTLADIVAIKRRMIGTGLIGGKSVGVLVARAILREADPRWNELLEIHDSFFIGSDVFYTFLVRNGCWWVRQKQKNPQTFLEGAETARRRILRGDFPDYILQQFTDMLDYFGQSPIIVRSSRLLEDNFGNAFSGKYESVFCVNQAPRDKRLEDFISAVRTIYASTMSEKALRYRASRGVLDRDEQMGLLVQRVSGSQYSNLFYPQIAGVGFSFNPYVWNEQIDPSSGVLRLVLGLGTRAVDRSDDDYTRLISLSAPDKRPEANIDDVRQYAQRKIDILDMGSDQLTSRAFADVAQQSPDLPINLFASEDSELKELARERGMREVFPYILTFDDLLKKTSFVGDMKEMLAVLQEAYDYPVDIEFAANFFDEKDFKINLLQCRPFQVKEGGIIADPPEDIEGKDLILQAHGAVIGQSRIDSIDRLIYVAPSEYGQLPVSDRYSVARVIGKVAHLKDSDRSRTVMLLGPGRWGTTTPSLGVPVNFAEINTVSILCEIVAMREDLVPDVSLGTHFFNDMVEMDILYLALFVHKENNLLNEGFFESQPNKLSELVPSASNWAQVVKVIDLPTSGDGNSLWINANTLKQKVVCYLGGAESPPVPQNTSSSRG
ncbi:MAG: pyruvate, phosphate dikinase [Planctomycetota bacterium]|nr:MAG: pyruvate, phosphate dikinase [Planctomycetota bacterium]